MMHWWFLYANDSVGRYLKKVYSIAGSILRGKKRVPRELLEGTRRNRVGTYSYTN